MFILQRAFNPNKSKSIITIKLIFRLADRVRTNRSYLWVFCVLISCLSCFYMVAISLDWISMPPFIFNAGRLTTIE